MTITNFSLSARWGVTRGEGTGNASVFVFDVSRSSADEVAYLRWATESGAANGAAADDFVAGALPGGMLVFGLGVATATFVVTVAGDRQPEADETFGIHLEPFGGGAVQGTDAVFTVTNDDVVPESRPDIVTIEGGPGGEFFLDATGRALIRGSGGNDQLVSVWRPDEIPDPTALIDTLDGGTGDDTLEGFAAAVFGGPGRDSIAASAAAVIDGGPGTDTLGTPYLTPVYFDPAIGGYVVVWSTTTGDATVVRSVEVTQSRYFFVHGTSGFDVVDPIEVRAGLSDVVHRFYNEARGVHFYTDSIDEAVHVRNTLPVFDDEGLSFRTAPEGAPGATPVYRFYNAGKGYHFYTASAEERDLILRTWPEYAFEGVAYRAYARDGGPQEELHRFYNATTGAHFFTTSDAERDWILATLPQFRDEGVGFYVDPL